MVDKNLQFFQTLFEYILPESLEKEKNYSINNASKKYLDVIFLLKKLNIYTF